MKAETQSLIDDIRSALDVLRRHLDWDNAVRRLEELNALVEDPNLWNDSDKAQALMRERTRLETQITSVQKIQSDTDDNAELIELGEAEGDEAIVEEAESSLVDIKEKVEKQQLESLLSGEADPNDCYLEVNSGAGGTEAQDWAEMLLRMYLRWAEKRGFKTTVMNRSDGEEAGVKSATVRIAGEMAYGWAKTETGVHRLVRISPYDSNARRHTSFASVAVSPVIDDNIDIEIEEKDLRIDTYRSSGAGGQHVNTTDSAVRITHEPTGVVVACQNERSQHKNKATAMSMLKARLYEREIQQRESDAAEAFEEKSDIGWGHAIRSYVLHPYQMVKDQRTACETTDTSGVLDGKIDAFLEAALAKKLDPDND
ncbi:MAG: peptide chain release factor 2 [Pseudomonadota bacterium]